MVLPKSKQNVGLGRTLKNDFRNEQEKRRANLKHTSSLDDGPSWTKLKSVTQERSLDEFLSTAELAGTDFHAEKQNIKVIQNDQKRNPFLLSPLEARKIAEKHRKHAELLRIPRRPAWDKSTTRAELDVNEKSSFLEWRRELAALSENNDLLLTPFERNLEVWRQLWRVIERSDLVVQIVDARNPLFFRSKDLEVYVKQVDPKKRNLLLVNKADMLTKDQRQLWANYFKAQGIQFLFFSAMMAADTVSTEDISDRAATLEFDDDEVDTRIITIAELEHVFSQCSPADTTAERTVVGLVGYPNVGKSSTINALLGEKKVSVSSTPGKTKHFQTLNLSSRVTLCDCPGLVFPNFATTKSDLVVNGVLPIDQLREYRGPVGLLTRRVSKDTLEATYSIRIETTPPEEGGPDFLTAEDLLVSYARSRGYWTTGQGNPDEARASRYILKDFVNGKLIFCHPPPDTISEEVFNTNGIKNSKYASVMASNDSRSSAPNRTSGSSLDKDFFKKSVSSRPLVRNATASSDFAGRSTNLPHQNIVNDDGTIREMSTGSAGSIPTIPKKHKKGKKNQKRRGANGYDAMGQAL